MPHINKRRLLDENKPDGYRESDRDYVLNNIDLCVRLLNMDAVDLLTRAADALDDCAAEQWSHYASRHPLSREIERKLKGE